MVHSLTKHSSASAPVSHMRVTLRWMSESGFNSHDIILYIYNIHHIYIAISDGLFALFALSPLYSIISHDISILVVYLIPRCWWFPKTPFEIPFKSSRFPRLRHSQWAMGAGAEASAAGGLKSSGEAGEAQNSEDGLDPPVIIRYYCYIVIIIILFAIISIYSNHIVDIIVNYIVIIILFQNNRIVIIRYWLSDIILFQHNSDY